MSGIYASHDLGNGGNNMPQVLSKFIRKGVDYVKSGDWKESLGETLTVTGEIFDFLGNFIPGARYIFFLDDCMKF